MRLHYTQAQRRQILRAYEAAPVGTRHAVLPAGVDRNAIRRWRQALGTEPQVGEVCVIPSQPAVRWTIEAIVDGIAHLVRVDDIGALLSTEVALAALQIVEVTT